MSAQAAYDTLVRDTGRMYGNNAPAWLAPTSVGSDRPVKEQRRAHDVALKSFMAVHDHLGRMARQEGIFMDPENTYYNLKFTSADYPLPLPPGFPEGAHAVVYCAMTEAQFAELGAEQSMVRHLYATYTNEDEGTSRDLVLDDLMDRQNDGMLVLVIQSLHYQKHAASLTDDEARSRAKTARDFSPLAAACLLNMCKGGVDSHIGMFDEDVIEQVESEYGLGLSDFSYID